MKILFINQFFWPDSSATSQLLQDLARGLSDRGHEVTVICADTAYALEATGDAPPVRIERVKALPFARGKIGRVLSYFSFYVSAMYRAFALPKADVVVSLTTPPLISLVGTCLKATRGSRAFIWEMDMYPDVAVDLNYFKAGGVADRVTGVLGDFSRRRANGILALGDCMKQRLIARGVAEAKIFVTENWADGDAIHPMTRPDQSKGLVLLYSGNLGLAHDVETLMGAMDLLRDDGRFSFLFTGGGVRRQELASFCAAKEITSVKLLPYVPRDELSAGLALGDIGVVTQKDVCCGSVVPSKVYGILAAGRPILFIGPRMATPALIVAQYGCGWQVDCGDVNGLTRLLLLLADHPEMTREAGLRAREVFLNHYNLPLGVGRIANILEGSPQHASTAKYPALNGQREPRRFAA